LAGKDGEAGNALALSMQPDAAIVDAAGRRQASEDPLEARH